jgi:hypothetical protein
MLPHPPVLPPSPPFRPRTLKHTNPSQTTRHTLIPLALCPLNPPSCLLGLPDTPAPHRAHRRNVLNLSFSTAHTPARGRVLRVQGSRMLHPATVTLRAGDALLQVGTLSRGQVNGQGGAVRADTHIRGCSASVGA